MLCLIEVITLPTYNVKIKKFKFYCSIQFSEKIFMVV